MCLDYAPRSHLDAGARVVLVVVTVAVVVGIQGLSAFHAGQPTPNSKARYRGNSRGAQGPPVASEFAA